MQVSRFETSDLAEVQSYAQRVYDPRFTAVGTVDSFHMSHCRVDHGYWSSDAVRFEFGGVGIVGHPYGMVSVCRLRAGRVRHTTKRDSLFLQTGDVFVAADAVDAYTREWSEADFTMFRLPVETLVRAAHDGHAASGNTHLAFLSRRPVTRAAARRFVQVAGFAERHLAEVDANTDGPVRAAVGQLLAATVLTTFPNTLVREPWALQPRADVSVTVDLAVEFVACNADLPIRASDIAAHVMVSERALQMAFREHLSTSPAEYLRRYRLARVHEELARATPGDGSAVTRVAARWTFTGSSRFVAHYRRIYGESPSETLRRDPHPPTRLLPP